ncbi:MAG: substrate-binding domain-containing protein [Candidatus Competibacteraceae bacterium]|jgi:phosphate transport system substrate-binding protein|nr:substrate-binding domain-containing protein [Candidatus Competibacteraceae bacterium]MBK7982221.1 substrate-binding domain-containing protein [Candidatus Competibacteraceae bacterium]MBK9952228.1 substrate-binding domain-containing protein [Candidatus Competibacteraceae bacterium]
MKNFRKLLLVTGLAAALSAGFGPAVAGADELKIGGGAAPIENIFKKVKEPFEKASGVQLTLTSEGPDQAFINVEKGAIDVAAAGLSFEAWLELMKQKGHEIANPKDFKFRVIGRDKIQVLAHKDLAAVKSLSKEQLKGIFTGKTTNWKEVGGPDKPVVVVFPTKMTGTNKLWQEKIMEGGEWPKANLQEVAEASDLKKKIAETSGAVGAGPMAAQDKGSLHSPETPEVGRPVTALTKGAPSANVQKLFDFIAGEGQKYIVR